MKKLVFLISFSTIFFVALSQDNQRVLLPIDVAKIKYVGNVIYSDDGNHLAYTLRIQSDPLIKNESAHYELHVYDVMTRKSKPFITRGSTRSIAFRPGHDELTFLNRLDGAKKTSLYSIPLSGGEAKELLQFKTSISNYQWSPNGKRLVFLAGEPQEGTESTLPYVPEIYESGLSWRKAWINDMHTGELKKLDIEGHVEAVSWSPDGEKLLVSAASTPLVDDHYMEQKLSIFSLTSMKIEATINHEGKKGPICWSPSSTHVAFIAGADKHDPVAGRLFFAPIRGGNPTIITKEWLGAIEDIEWLEDDRIHFLGSRGAESVVGTIEPRNGQISETMATGLSINSIDFISGGKITCAADRWNHPPELFIGNNISDLMRITISNPWLDEIKMGKQEVVKYPAQDDLEIEGILIYPVDYDQGAKYPLLVSVHGGPESHINNGWITGYSNPGQVAAGQGYAVFYPNYRGSTGRGMEYTLSSQGDAAGKEFDDIVDGVDFLIEKGLVDQDRVGVTGGSYGGYATGWLSTKYSDRFAGGVMFVGISNKISKWGTTDIPNEEYLVHAREWVYNHYDFYLKRSPIYYAGQCKTPLLIMHGKQDPRVHPSQSMEMYRHVKSRTNTPVELVFYPGEGHGNAKSTARYDFNLRMMSWFDKYVKKDPAKP